MAAGSGAANGAALAYYMALSLAPTVIIILAVTGLAFGAKAAQGRLVGQIQGLVGKEGAVVIQSMIEGAHRSSTGLSLPFSDSPRCSLAAPRW